MKMSALGLDGKIYSWNPHNNLKSKNNCSKLHIKAREILKDLFPFDKISEEIRIPGIKPALYIDLYIHQQRLVVEVQGEQHYSFNAFFFKNKRDFYLAKQRDQIKRDWCKINNLFYVELPFNVDNWKELIINRERL